MKSFLAADRYARSLDRLIADDHETERIARELDQLAAVYKSSPELRSALANPALHEPVRLAILDSVMDRCAAPELVRKLAAVMLRRRRIDLLPAVARLFDAQSDRRLNRVEADITSAAPLNDEQARRVVDALESYTGKHVRAEFDVDPELIGGVRARIEDLILDGSLRNRLERLKEHLLPEEESGG